MSNWERRRDGEARREEGRLKLGEKIKKGEARRQVGGEKLGEKREGRS